MEKIVYVVESFGSGVYSFLVDLCNNLVNDYEIVIIYSYREDTPKNFEKDFNFKVKFVNIDMCRGLNLYKNIKSLFQLRKVLNRENPDLIHLHSSKAGFLGRIASYANGFNMNKVFYNPHGFSFLQKNESRLRRKIFYLLEKFAAKLGGYIIGCSQGEYQEALKLTHKSLNINNGIDIYKIDNILIKLNLNENEKDESKSKITIGTIGRICYQKNPKLFNEIAECFPNHKFVWIGDGELKGSLKSKNICITGWMERNKVLEKILDIDIYLMTSLWEGLPLSLLEAMYLERPCIVTDVIGNRDVIQNRKNGFIASDIEEFTFYLNKLINDINFREKIAYQAKNSVKENFNLKKMINEYKNIYKKFLLRE